MSTPNNLPAELTSFIGRERQLAELRRLMRRSRLITLTGPGGAGKTRLALRLVAGLLDRFPGGVFLVEMGPLSDPALLERAVAAACRVRESKKQPIGDLLVERLGGPPTLLVFDGAEHLIDACQSLGEALLRAARNLSLLVTSREPLGISGELIWRTPSLTVASPGTSGPIGVMQSEAGRLFLDRALLARPDFVLAPEAQCELAEICARLEGLPLAIELAASLVGAMTLDEIRLQLHDRYRLLTGGSRSAIPRTRTLRHAIDWSYDRLSPDEQDLFQRLSVFAGGFDLDGAQAVASGASEGAVATLMRLVDKSLVVAEAPRPTRSRYRMLDTIREYAADKLEPSASATARQKHAAHFFAFSEKAARELLGGEQAMWLDRIEDETPNLRLALSWYEVESPDEFMTMTGRLARYWYVRGRFADGLEWFDRALAAGRRDGMDRLAVLQNRARLRRLHGDYDGARRDAEECVAVARRLGADRHLLAALLTLGNLSASVADWKAARGFFTAALEHERKSAEPSFITSSLNNLALVDSAEGRHEAAKQRIEEALDIVEHQGDRILRASVRESAGRIARRCGDRVGARLHYMKALELSSEFEDMLNIADVLDGLALLALQDRDPHRALVLAAASGAQRAASESETYVWDRTEVRDGMARARSMLSPSAVASAVRKGEAMSLRQAVAYAMGAPPVTRAEGGIALTAREMQVASLIVDGLTNGEIAARLNVSERTADAHVEHIRNKLGLHTRSQIAVWAHEKRVTA